MPGDLETRHEVMACPVCKRAIFADVTVRPILGTPVVKTEGTVTVPVTAEMTRFTIQHRCSGRVVNEAAADS